MGALMRLNFLKNLFKKKDVDWDSREYLKKNLELIQKTKTYDLYQENAEAKEKLEQELINLIDS